MADGDLAAVSGMQIDRFRPDGSRTFSTRLEPGTTVALSGLLALHFPNAPESGPSYIEGYSVEDGARRFRTQVSDAQMYPTFSSNDSLAMDGVIVVPLSRMVVALDVATGAIRWRRLGIQPRVISVNGAIGVYSNNEAGTAFEIVDARSGQSRAQWNTSIRVTAVAAGDVGVFASGTRDGKYDQQLVVAGWSFEGLALWSPILQPPNHEESQPVVEVNGRLYLRGGTVIDASTGKEASHLEWGVSAPLAGHHALVRHLVSGDQQVLGMVDLSTGKPAWSLVGGFAPPIDQLSSGDLLFAAWNGKRSVVCRRDRQGTRVASVPLDKFVYRVALSPRADSIYAAHWETLETTSRDFVHRYEVRLVDAPAAVPTVGAGDSPAPAPVAAREPAKTAWKGQPASLRPVACDPGLSPKPEPVGAIASLVEHRDSTGNVVERVTSDDHGRPLATSILRRDGSEETTYAYSGEVEILRDRWTRSATTQTHEKRTKILNDDGTVAIERLETNDRVVTEKRFTYEAGRPSTIGVYNGDGTFRGSGRLTYTVDGLLRKEFYEYDYYGDYIQTVDVQDLRYYDDGSVMYAARWFETSQAFTPDGRILSENGRGATRHVYDTDGRPVRTVEGDGGSPETNRTVRRTFEADGRVALEHRIISLYRFPLEPQYWRETARYVYACEGGRLLREELDVNEDGVVDGVRSLDYDVQGRLVRERFTGAASATSSGGLEVKEIRRSYALGRRQFEELLQADGLVEGLPVHPEESGRGGRERTTRPALHHREGDFQDDAAAL